MAKDKDVAEPASGAALSKDIDIMAITREQIAASQEQTQKLGDMLTVLKDQAGKSDATAAALQLVTQMVGMMQSQIPPREIKEGDPEWVERMQKEGFYDDFFGVTVLQNAYEAQARGLSEETRRRASQLKDGSYIKGRVRVSVEKGGAIVRISYPIQGDNRLINQEHWKNFPDLVNQIWDEMHAVPA